MLRGKLWLDITIKMDIRRETDHIHMVMKITWRKSYTPNNIELALTLKMFRLIELKKGKNPFVYYKWNSKLLISFSSICRTFLLHFKFSFSLSNQISEDNRLQRNNWAFNFICPLTVKCHFFMIF